MIYNLDMPNPKREELALRIREFGFEIIKLTRLLPKNEENKVFTKQILRSATSVGANYAEAIYGQTRQEFIHCLTICRKESNETLYWLEMILYANPSYNKQINLLVEENRQILRIFISSTKTISLKR